ncbi:hypothetical protein BKA61DRAFT_307394 [Leptodontidium sp. MPI-SDFR-AT-0119]|nr:hypothetical protein BKA61DRAFT_307394 [Leptodontidium sp. MPI-SDFR-AT-0119]
METFPEGNFYRVHATKADYDRAFRNARDWALENPEELPHVAARIYHVKEDSLRQSVHRLKNRTRNEVGNFNRHGGNNKILAPAQEEAIRQYCYEQWELGMGATHEMVRAAIGHLRAAQTPPLPPPSKRWFADWLKANKNLHTIKTKPIEHARLESHTEEDVKK